MSKKRNRQEEEEDRELEDEDVENVFLSAKKRTPTPPFTESEKLRTPGGTPIKLTTENDVTGNVSYRSSKQEISSDSEEDDDDAIAVAADDDDNDDDDDDDDDDGITVIINRPVAWNPETNADAVLRERRLASSPKFNLEGILQMYEDLVLYDFK